MVLVKPLVTSQL